MRTRTVVVVRSVTALLAVCAALMLLSPNWAAAGGGQGAGAAARGAKVLPPDATPSGWSLDDMAEAVANFSISGNDTSFLPDTPFQILYNNHAGNTFNVKP